jgi:MFS family permease
MSVPEIAKPEKTPLYAYYVVGVLMLAYVFAFIDRIILSLVVDPIRADLGLSDTQVSLLAGFAFALFYTFLGIPFGRWVDTRGRRNLIAMGIALWSIATVACGLANNFVKLFIARMAVGVGEATLAPSAYSMIPDVFPRHRIAFAMAVFMSGVTIGGGLAMLLGGIIVEWATTAAPVLPLLGQIAPWKVAFIAVGLPGLLVALLVATTVKEPQRRIEANAKDEAPKLSEVLGYVGHNWRVYAPAILGFTGIVVAGYAFQFWGPAYFMRLHGFSPTEVGVLFGVCFSIIGTLGVLAGGAFSDRLTRSGLKDAPLRVAMWAAVIQAPLFIACYLSASTLAAQIFFAVALFFASAFGGLQGATIQMLTPNRMRGVVSAVYLMTANMIGLGIAPTITAMVSEHVFGGPLGIGKALAVTCGVSLSIGAILLLLSLKPARERVAALEGSQAPAGATA